MQHWEVKYVVRLSKANFINNYPQPVFHFNESQLRCVKVIVTQTLQRRPLAAHASKFRVSGNTPLSLRYSSLPANVFRGSSCVPAPGTRDEPPKIVYGGGYRYGPIYMKRKQPDTTPSTHFFCSGYTTQRMFFVFVKVRIPGGTCMDSPFNGFFHFWHGPVRKKSVNTTRKKPES